MKLTENEKKYTLKQWAEVVWLVVRHPINSLIYFLVDRPRKERLSKMTLDERLSEARGDLRENYLNPLRKADWKEKTKPDNKP